MDCLRDKFVGGLLLDGRYETISPLNHGSFGMVFMAQDLHNDKPVAIKVLTKQYTPEEPAISLTVDEKSEELSLHSRLGCHPSIVNLLHSFETDAHVYLVLEFCSQGDLYEAIRNGHGPLQTEHVRQLMLQLVDAVAYSHSKGVYHRDIKPENIFLTQDGIMKLGDFGLATTDTWSYETTVGSDRYMAPEQFDSAGAGYSPASADIWAIGICLLNVLFSRNPFSTPTESDPLFLDFSRDKQSLFDVFPSMSQDTYEVIVQCMNLDPRKRSLVGARAALLRVVSFTTEDEALDDFCGAEKATVASANREPLRTPSIQIASTDTGPFPWAKALHMSSHQSRQLSAIPDGGSYTEDLFSKSGGTADWSSASIQTPPVSSMLDSHLSAQVGPTVADRRRQSGMVSPMAGSLPIAMAKPLGHSMSTVLGRRLDAVSKSWSDMWDEDFEEEARERQIRSLKELNSRTWSRESGHIKNGQAVPESASEIRGDIDEDLVADGFFFHEPLAGKPIAPIAPRYSPPSKRSNYDKWTALGERRRGGGNFLLDSDKASSLKPNRPFAFGYYNKSCEAGVWDHHNDGSSPVNKNWGKERSRDCLRYKGRDWNWRRDRREGLGDLEWVGGW